MIRIQKTFYRNFILLFITAIIIMSWQFTVSAAETPSVTIQIPVSQETGNDPDAVHDYNLSPDSPENPMPDNSEYNLSIIGNDTADIPITFHHGGIYTYTIENDSNTTDPKAYEITVYVKNEADGSLSYSMTVTDGKGKEDEIRFTYETKDPVTENGYTQDGTQTENRPDTSDRSNAFIWILMFFTSIVVIFIVWEKSKNASP